MSDGRRNPVLNNKAIEIHMKIISLPGISILFIFLFVFCMSCDSRHGKNVDSAFVGDTVAEQEFEGETVITRSDSGRLVWVLRTVHIVKNSAEPFTLVEPVNLQFFNQQGKIISTLSALTGGFNEKSEDIFAKGQVKVISQEQEDMELTTEKLDYLKSTNKIVSTEFVQIKTKTGDVMEGVGFESDPNLSHWSIKKGVSGRFREFKRRME